MLLASVVGGPVAGVHEAGTALIDMLVKSDPEMKVALKRGHGRIEPARASPADRIYVLDEGRIVESGNHDQLMANDHQYADLFRLQAAAYLAPNDVTGTATSA